MGMTRRFRPLIECLEDRVVLNSDTGEPVDNPDSDPNSTTQTVDPTADPVDPSNISQSGTITALGPLVNGKLQSIDVTGISAGDSFTNVQLQIGSNTYTVDFISALDDGSYRLTVSAGIDPTGVDVGDNVTVIFGSGSNDSGGDSNGGGDVSDPNQTLPPNDPIEDPVG